MEIQTYNSLLFTDAWHVYRESNVHMYIWYTYQLQDYTLDTLLHSAGQKVWKVERVKYLRNWCLAFFVTPKFSHQEELSFSCLKCCKIVKTKDNSQVVGGHCRSNLSLNSLQNLLTGELLTVVCDKRSDLSSKATVIKLAWFKVETSQLSMQG